MGGSSGHLAAEPLTPMYCRGRNGLRGHTACQVVTGDQIPWFCHPIQSPSFYKKLKLGIRESGQDGADFTFQKIRNAEGEAWLVKAIGFVTGETLFLFATEHGNNSVTIRSHLL